MKLLAVLDKQDYDPRAPRIYRRAVRGIIADGGRLAMIRSAAYGEYKFPGGGVERGESDPLTLIREVREETGLSVLPSTIRIFGRMKEIRKSLEGAAVFEHDSCYYACRVGRDLMQTQLDDYEKEYGYSLVYVTPAEALANNRPLFSVPAIPWVERDTYVLELLLSGGMPLNR